jgi:hypothetical protein
LSGAAVLRISSSQKKNSPFLWKGEQEGLGEQDDESGSLYEQ